MQVSQCFSTFRFLFASKEKGKFPSWKTKKKTIFEILSLYFKRFRLAFGSKLSSGAQKLPFYAQQHTYLRHRNCHILSLPWTKSCAAFRFNFYQKVLIAILRFRGFVLGIAGLFLHTNFSNLGAMCFPQGKGENMAPKVLKVRTPK